MSNATSFITLQGDFREEEISLLIRKSQYAIQFVSLLMIFMLWSRKIPKTVKGFLKLIRKVNQSLKRQQ